MKTRDFIRSLFRANVSLEIKDPEVCADGEISEDSPQEEPFASFIPPYFVKKKSMLYKRCKVAGVSYRDLDDIWDELDVGTKLALVRQRDNKYDKNAVAVALRSDFEDEDGNPTDLNEFDFDVILGYIPRNQNSTIAKLLDMGWYELFDVEISDKSSEYVDYIEIDIHIKNKYHDMLDKVEKSIRVGMLEDDEYKDLTTSLKENGYVYFRWLYQRNVYMPQMGDKVALIRREKDQMIFYLMHVLAKGERCTDFTGESEDRIDDCIGYVLTNIKGPVVVKNEQLPFPVDTDFPDHPYFFMPADLAEPILSIFE